MTKDKTLLLVATVTLAYAMVLACPARAASFDCRNASTQVEKLICADEFLSQLDADLAAVYALALKDKRPNQRDDFKARQSAWIRTVRDECKDRDCLITTYADRIENLGTISVEEVKSRYVTDPTERQRQIAEIVGELDDFGFSAASYTCDLMVKIVPERGRDVSYGTRCSAGDKSFIVCNDTMVGKLAVRFYSSGDGADLTRFTASNCPPGG